MTNTTYKQTAIGLIPSEWEVRKLGEIADVDKKSLKSDTNPKYQFDYISLSDVDSDDFNIETSKQIFKSAPSRARRIVNKGDILMSTVRPNLQGFSIIRNNVNDLIASTGFAVITANDCDNFFLYQYIFSNPIQKQFYGLLVGSNYPAINSSDVKLLKIPLPPLAEQQKIAAILSTWDVAIDNCKAIIEELKDRNKGLLNKLIIENGELKVKLGDIFIESKIPAINSNVNKRITVRLNLKGIEKRGVRGSEIEEATAYYLRKSGQFIYGKQNLHKGAFGIIPNELDGFESSSDIPAFDVNENFNIKYILYYFSRVHFFEKLEAISTGTGSKRIQPRELYKINIRIPSTIDKQNEIVEILDTATEELNQYQQKLQTLQLQKKGLMQQLLTGKVRVKI